MCKTIIKEYLHRTRLILKTHLSPRNRIKAINQLSVPVFQYSCGIVNWPRAGISKRNIRTRKLLTIHKMFHKNQCIPRMCLLRKGGGAGLNFLMELNQVHRATTVGLAEYVKSSTDDRIQFVYNKPEKISLTHLAKSFKKK